MLGIRDGFTAQRGVGGHLSAIALHVREARAVLAGDDVAGDDVATGTALLRRAELSAGAVPSDADEFQAVLGVRNELGCCLLAASQLEEAGVAVGVVAGVLRRGAANAEGMLPATAS